MPRVPALAAILLATATAFARTGEVTLNIVGDERMAEELRKLTEDLDKDQPLTGDSLALLQGAQARRARIAPRDRRGYPHRHGGGPHPPQLRVER